MNEMDGWMKWLDRWMERKIPEIDGYQITHMHQVNRKHRCLPSEPIQVIEFEQPLVEHCLKVESLGVRLVLRVGQPVQVLDVLNHYLVEAVVQGVEGVGQDRSHAGANNTAIQHGLEPLQERALCGRHNKQGAHGGSDE